jgi:hypothetical protein
VTKTERMPSLVVGNTELFGGGKWKNGKGFLKPNSEPLPKLRQVRQVRRASCRFVGFAFIKISKSFRADLLLNRSQKGARPGVENPVTPDGPDVLDGGDGVEGLGFDGLAAGWLMASICE